MRIFSPIMGLIVILLGTCLFADVVSERQITRRPPGSMNRETIEIREIKQNYFKVTVNYWFEGDINSFFPLAFPETERVQLIGFSATAGGLPLKVEKRVAGDKGTFRFRGQRYPVLYRLTADQKIPETNGETHSSNEYFFTAPRFSQKDNTEKLRLIEYVLITGGGWSGNTIGDLTITVSFFADRCKCALPLNHFSTGRCISPRSMRLHVRDWKPEENFELAIPEECREKRQ